MAKRVLFIGGSLCSGKSTVAERILKEYGAYYFKVDDGIDSRNYAREIVLDTQYVYSNKVRDDRDRK